MPDPAFTQADNAKRIAPHLADGQVVFLAPGTFGSYVMTKIVREAGNRAEFAFAETGTLPWLTRKHGPTTAAITARATRLPTGVYPRRSSDACFRGDPKGVQEHRAGGRRAFGRADERRPDHPSAAHPDERRAAGARRSVEGM